MNACRYICALLIVLLLAGCLQPTPTIYLRDDQGRAMILHGVNVGNDAKGDPLRVGNIDSAMVKRLNQDWGFNAVRMLVFWDAIEPSPGVFDQNYLDRVVERLDWYQQNNMKVILDMHQDVYSSVFCCDGAPAWAVRNDGIPFVQQSVWWHNYSQDAVRRSFDNFWNHEGPNSDLQQHYAQAWLTLINRVKDHPAVLGYELMNEPNEGSADSHKFEETSLAGFYQRLIDKIRVIDQDHWLFVEPVGGLTVIGSPSKLPTLNDPRSGEQRLAFFPHLYEPTLSAGAPYFGLTTFIDQWVNSRRDEMTRLQAPVLIGEFGEDETKGGFNRYLQDMFSRTENSISGWFLWNYDRGSWGLLNMAGEENKKMAVLVQPYPSRIAGDPTLIRYQPDSRTLTLRYLTRQGVEGMTEMIIPKRIYPEGWHLNTGNSELQWQWDEAQHRLSIPQAQVPAGTLIEITLSPK